MSREEFEKEFNEKVEALRKELVEKYFNNTDGNTEKTLEETIGYLDEYYIINFDETVCPQMCCYDNDDNELFEIGNFYLTKEEAEFEVERRKVIRELKKCAEKKPINTKGCYNHFIYYDSSKERVLSCANNSNCYNFIYFLSKRDAEKAIKTIGEDRLKKYYFGVED